MCHSISINRYFAVRLECWDPSHPQFVTQKKISNKSSRKSKNLLDKIISPRNIRNQYVPSRYTDPCTRGSSTPEKSFGRLVLTIFIGSRRWQLRRHDCTKLFKHGRLFQTETKYVKVVVKRSNLFVLDKRVNELLTYHYTNRWKG